MSETDDDSSSAAHEWKKPNLKDLVTRQLYFSLILAEEHAQVAIKLYRLGNKEHAIRHLVLALEILENTRRKLIKQALIPARKIPSSNMHSNSKGGIIRKALNIIRTSIMLRRRLEEIDDKIAGSTSKAKIIAEYSSNACVGA